MVKLEGKKKEARSFARAESVHVVTTNSIKRRTIQRRQEEHKYKDGESKYGGSDDKSGDITPNSDQDSSKSDDYLDLKLDDVDDDIVLQ